MKNPSLTKSLYGLLLIVALIALSSSVFAKGKKKSIKRISPPGSHLKTDLRFNSSNVYGKVHKSYEARGTVQEEKVMRSLLGFRMDFKDRLSLIPGQLDE